jgi:hypothetical protein
MFEIHVSSCVYGFEQADHFNEPPGRKKRRSPAGLIYTVLRLSPQLRIQELSMSCLKGKNKHKPKPGRYRCKKCDAVSKKKKHLCKPKKIKSSDGKKS